MLNKNLSFKKERNIFTVLSFFNEDVSKNFSNDIQKIPDHWWYWSLRPVDSSNNKLNIRDYTNIIVDIPDQLAYVKNTFNSGNFSYSFRRTTGDHYQNCYCVVCKLDQAFKSQEVKDAISKIIDEPVTSINETFASKYMTDDFLSIHHDKTNGEYAFIYQMTPKWNPSHGGLLNFWNSENNEVYKTIYPVINSLTIFKIKDVPITDHFVSVNSGPNSRYAYSGWFTC
jgi:hypothetical protein